MTKALGMTDGEVKLAAEYARATYSDPAGFALEAGGHALRLLLSGKERFQALTQLIDGASHLTKLSLYIFQPDHAGTQVRGALIRAAQRGVDVHLIVDAFGSDASAAFLEPIEKAGGKVSVFAPRWNVRYLIRNHQKFVIADNARAITGGFNISDLYFSDPREDAWADLGIVIEGEVVSRFSDWFAELQKWVGNSGSQFFAIRKLVRDWHEGEGDVQLLLGGPSKITSA